MRARRLSQPVLYVNGDFDQTNSINGNRQGSVTGKATLMVRPEAFSIVGQTFRVEDPLLQGRLVQRTFLGNMARYTVETPQGVMIVDDDAFTSRRLSDEVIPALTPDRLHVLPTT